MSETVISEGLKEPDREQMLEWAPFDVTGDNFEVALALHHGLGWHLRLIKSGNEVLSACVVTPDDELFSILHPMEEENLLTRFGAHTVETCTEEDLQTIRAVNDAAVQQALWWAWCVRRDLPWVVSPDEPFVRFVEELFALWQQHGFTIWGDLLAHPPLIARASGEEVGFTLSAVMGTAPSFKLKRRFND